MILEERQVACSSVCDASSAFCASAIPCCLCGSERVREWGRDAWRDYFRCEACGLVFVPSRQFLSLREEKKRYDLHQNSLLDPGYRGFLNRLLVPLEQRLAPGSSGLDFGSGPVPALARMLEKAGHPMTLYDPYYAPTPAALEEQYDFITASEVVEHLREPRNELDRLWQCLKPGGTLGIMTKFVVDTDAFPEWHYKNDRTHVCFFSEPTFTWLTGRWGADIVFPANDVVLIMKRAAGREAAPGREKTAS